MHIDPSLDIRPTAARAWDPGLLAEPGAGPGARDCLPPPPPAPSALISGVRAGVVRAGACVVVRGCAFPFTTGSRPGAAQSPASVGHKSIYFLPPGSIRTGTPSTRTLHFVGAARFPSRTLLCQARGSARPAADPARPGALPVSGTSPSMQVVGDAVPPCGAACAAAWGGVCVGSAAATALWAA